MRLYQLHIEPGEYEAEGEDQDEWFSALAEAKKRRRELIALYDPENFKGTEDYAIDLVEIDTDLPLRRLLLAVLNGKGFAKTTTNVVPAWRAPGRQLSEDDEEADDEESSESA